MTVLTRPTTFSERRLNRACQYVSDMWFPANPQLLEDLRAGLGFDTTPDFEMVLSEIKSDFSLYLLCIRELLSLLKQEGVNPPEHLSPLELLRWGGIERLRTILAAPDVSISPHTFSSPNEAQRQRMEEVVISTSTAQVLAKEMKINPDLGFSAALLRQLGFTLIAWNYPEVYQQAMGQLKEGSSLEETLTKILGFSPSTLALTLARRWGLTSELCQTLLDETADEYNENEYEDDAMEHAENDAISSTLATLCRVGEALARANAPEVYPSARSDWESAKAELYQRIGTQGLTLIQDAIEESCSNYATVVPTLFTPGALLNPELRLEVWSRDNLISRNPYVNRCRDFVKAKLEKLYSGIQSGQVTDTLLRQLVHGIIPDAGFCGGRVYTLDPASQSLVTQLKFGSIQSDLTDVIPTNLLLISSNQIVRAYNADESVCQSMTTKDQVPYTSLAGYLGFSQRIGVLYLEIPDLVLHDSEEYHLNHFKAFCMAFNDCLDLQ